MKGVNEVMLNSKNRFHKKERPVEHSRIVQYLPGSEACGALCASSERAAGVNKVSVSQAPE